MGNRFGQATSLRCHGVCAYGVQGGKGLSWRGGASTLVRKAMAEMRLETKGHTTKCGPKRGPHRYQHLQTGGKATSQETERGGLTGA